MSDSSSRDISSTHHGPSGLSGGESSSRVSSKWNRDGRRASLARSSGSSPTEAAKTAGTSQSTVKRARGTEQRRIDDIDDETEWTRLDKVLLERTLRLHTVSPMHFSSLPASVQDVSRSMFQMLRSELHQYVNMRLSDGHGFLEGATGGSMINPRDPESGDLRPPARRRRAEVNKVGKVRIGYLDDRDFVRAFQAENRSGDRQARPWIIELELGRPTSEATAAPTAEEALPSELCHIVFIPASTPKDDGRKAPSISYPLIATKTPSATLASNDALLPDAPSNIGPLVLAHALDWIQKRFDCRIALATGNSSIVSQLRGRRLESLAEEIVRQTRFHMGAQEGVERTPEQRMVDETSIKPVELSFAMPTSVQGRAPLDGPGKSRMLPGPAPELATLTLTVPWEICMQLLETQPLDMPLLPPLNDYLSHHTSIPLDLLELTRIGVAGVSVGSGRIKISSLPASEPGRDGKGTSKRLRDSKEMNLADKRRAGAVFGFLRSLVEGAQD
ncbi:hypothetical protein BCV70DRAFT_189123 [Testicularia cyperi]|uniref:Uncharacterized protein n=1 Tax=Testicularia cyperi TaxID=1882483 RepID=A0A317XQI5_9BASI|nr:hypothetical protein BCV70DRAFT_189123 [Testicularia cyperi]